MIYNNKPPVHKQNRDKNVKIYAYIHKMKYRYGMRE